MSTEVWRTLEAVGLLPKEGWGLSKLMHQEVLPAVSLQLVHSEAGVPTKAQLQELLATKRVQGLCVGQHDEAVKLLICVWFSPRWPLIQTLKLTGPELLLKALPLPEALQHLDLSNMGAAKVAALARLEQLPPDLKTLNAGVNGARQPSRAAACRLACKSFTLATWCCRQASFCFPRA
jgi:hypothetical protein